MTSLSDPPARRNGKNKDKAKVLRETIDDRLEQLAKAIDDVRASELFKQYLDVQSRFHKYSWHNTMMIVSQKPDAERVAEVREAAGHSNVSTTSLYVHVCTDDDDEAGNLFDFTHNSGNGDPRP